MRFKTFLTALVLLLVGLAAVAVAVVNSIDFNAYKDLVAQQVKVVLGRDLVIAGDVTVSIGLTPHLSARQVTLRNASWSDQPQMIALDRVDADIELFPLLFEQIRLRNVTLSGGQILLERNKDGVGNWAFDTAAGNAGGGSAVGAPLPQLDKFAVENFKLRYQDPTHRHDVDLQVQKFTARDSASGGPVSWALEGTLNKVPVDLKGTIGTMAQFVTGPLPIDLRGTLADINVQFGGTIRNAGTLKGLDLDLQMSGSNAAKLNPLLNTAMPDTAAFNLVGHVSDPDNGYRLDRLQLTIGSSYISGLAVIFTDRQPTLLRAQVTADRVDLVDFGFSAPAADSKPADADAQAKAQAGGNRIFSDTPWPIGFLTSFDADIALTLQDLRRGAPILTNGKLGLSLQGGVLTVKSLKAVIDDGKISATGTLRAADDKPSLDINLTADHVGSAPLLAAAGLSDVLSTGGVDLDLAVTGPARSTHDMMAGLSGNMRFATGSGTLRNSFARLILADVTKLISVGGSADATHVSCLAGRFDIDGGKAKTAGLVMDTPGAALVGTGTIDLGAENIQMRVDSKSKQISLAALAVPMLVTGPLRHPTVTPDTMGAIGNTANFVTGTVNKATLGMLSTLTGLGAQQSLGGNPCATLTSVGSKQDSPGQKIKQGVDAVGTGAKEVVKGVGEGAGTVSRDVGNSINRGVNSLFGN